MTRAAITAVGAATQIQKRWPVRRGDVEEGRCGDGRDGIPFVDEDVDRADPLRGQLEPSVTSVVSNGTAIRADGIPPVEGVRRALKAIFVMYIVGSPSNTSEGSAMTLTRPPYDPELKVFLDSLLAMLPANLELDLDHMDALRERTRRMYPSIETILAGTDLEWRDIAVYG